jgi:hypothetical protein
VSNDLITTARRLAQANANRPRQADLRRAVSTAYCALFHVLARHCADLFIGLRGRRNEPAWAHVYRALEHGFARNACQQVANLGLPIGLVIFAESFVALQKERNRADYDPVARYTRAETMALIANAEKAIASFSHASRPDRRAFAAHVLLRRRPN